MLTDTEEKVFDLIVHNEAGMDTADIVRRSDVDPLEVPKAIGGLLKAGMVRVIFYLYAHGDKIPNFGVA